MCVSVTEALTPHVPESLDAPSGLIRVPPNFPSWADLEESWQTLITKDRNSPTFMTSAFTRSCTEPRPVLQS